MAQPRRCIADATRSSSLTLAKTNAHILTPLVNVFRCTTFFSNAENSLSLPLIIHSYLGNRDILETILAFFYYDLSNSFLILRE